MTKELKEFLQKEGKVLKISHIENETGIPRSTIGKAVAGEQYRGLNEDQEKGVDNYLKALHKCLGKYLSKKFGSIK